jgi:hypothetical protein
MVLLLTLFSGIRCSTSQCSTILPSLSNLNMSIPAQSLLSPGQFLITMQDHIVSFCYHPLEVNTLTWVLFCHSLKIFNESLLAVSHRRVVLNVNLSKISLDRFGRVVLIEHQVIECSRSFCSVQVGLSYLITSYY